MDRRLSRRKLSLRPTLRPTRRVALAVGALVLAVPGVSACGFNYATDREYTPANGVNNKDGDVDVLNALIVSGEDGSGTFIATLSNNDRVQAASLESLSFGTNSTVQVAEFSPIEVPAHGVVNLANGEGIKVSGDFGAGDFIGVSLAFDNGETADLNVPVVAEDDEYTGFDNGTGVPSPAAEPSAS
jgi:hypothetical protein